MQELEAPASPAVFYKDTHGKVRRVLGVPEQQIMHRRSFRLSRVTDAMITTREIAGRREIAGPRRSVI